MDGYQTYDTKNLGRLSILFGTLFMIGSEWIRVEMEFVKHEIFKFFSSFLSFISSLDMARYNV